MEEATHYSERERAADAVEREGVAMKMAEYMSEHIGEVYTGFISYVSEYGFFVVLNNTIEGFVRIGDLPRDRYQYVKERCALVGRQFDFSIGDEVLIYVKDANKELRTIDFGVNAKEYEKDEKKGKGKKKVKTR